MTQVSQAGLEGFLGILKPRDENPAEPRMWLTPQMGVIGINKAVTEILGASSTLGPCTRSRSQLVF